MKNVPSTFTRISLLLLVLMTSSCREFYDEEFLQEQQQISSGGGGNGGNGNSNNVSYEAQLQATEAGITTITGNSSVDVQGDRVNVSVQLQGIPENIIQLHYGFIAASCDTLMVDLPEETRETKTYTLSESTTADSLRMDLASSGASNTNGDIDLSNKSFVVKGFTSITSTTTGTIGAAMMIACGDLEVATNTDTDGNDPDGGSTDFPNPDTPSGTTGTDGTGTTTGTDFPGPGGTTTGTDFPGTTGFPGTTTGTGFPDTTTGTEFPTDTTDSTGDFGF